MARFSAIFLPWCNLLFLTNLIDKTTPNTPVLIVKKGKQTLKVPAFKSIVYLDGKELALKSVTVYIDKNDTFYLPVELANYFLPVSKKNSK